MATYGQAVRRGLPRVPGGEPWPRAGEAPAGVATDGAERESDLAPAAEAPSAIAPQGTPDVADTAPGREPEADAAPHTAAAPSLQASGEQTTAATTAATARPLRRGLPRVPGGEPWPPAGLAAGAAVARDGGAESVAGQDAIGRPQTAAAAGAERAADQAISGAAATAAAEARPSAGADAPSVVGEGADGTALRRGLPRVPGGEPWPPAGVAPAALAHHDHASPAPDAAASTAAAAEPPAAAPAPASTAAASTAAAEAPSSALAPAAASVAVATGPRPPLPFTRTVWAGATAGARPPERPEPARIGPFTRMQWVGAIVVGGFGLLFAAAMAVFAVRALISFDAVRDFLETYPGEYHLPEGAPVGFPAWLGWQHFFNSFLIVLIIRSGLQVRNEKRPSVFWSPRGNAKRKISLALWLHQALDILWIVNGVAFVVLLFVTGQWMRIVPTSWEVFPNAVSAALQYVSLDWPTENGWVNYNSLQQLAYFTTVFVAAPLAIITGVRMSGIWPKNAKTLNRLYPVEWARAVHFPVMIYFVVFIFAHVVLVFATGALRNLNHMYAAQDAVNWTGFWIFTGSMIVIAAGWVAARPLVLAPIAGLFGTVKGR